MRVCEHPNLVPRYEPAAAGKDAVYVQDCPDCPAWGVTHAGFLDGCVLPPLAPWVVADAPEPGKPPTGPGAGALPKPDPWRDAK